VVSRGNQDKSGVLSRPIRDDEYEWEYERSRFAGWDASELAETVAVATIRPPKYGHAYLSSELKNLREILKADPSVWSDDRLYRYTDEFAAYVGLALRTVRKISSKDRLAELESRLVEPATTLLEALQAPDFSKEFLVPWSGLRVRPETLGRIAEFSEHEAD
jgi:hypothetical protein